MCMSTMHVCYIFGKENYGISTISKFVCEHWLKNNVTVSFGKIRLE